MLLKFKILIFLASLVFATCLPSQDDKEHVSKEPVIYCQPQTPCAWKFFKYIDYPEMVVDNTYCICSSSEVCIVHEHNLVGNFLEYRCKFDRDQKK